MQTNDATRATAEAMPDIGDAVDTLNRAWSMVELINMAAEAGNVTGEAGNAIAWGCIAVQELLSQEKDHLEPRAPESMEGGAA
jgi:hypothetical protein